MNYVDKYGQWQPKETGEFPSSNDGMIISAYAKKLGFPIDVEKIEEMWDSLPRREMGVLPTMRTPDKPTPYLSRDVLLGAGYLGVVGLYDVRPNDWNFSPFPLPEFNIFKLVSQLWKLRKLHRNHFWTNPGFEQVYHVAFMVPFADRAFFYAREDQGAPYIYQFIQWIDKKIKPGNASSALIRWLKYDQKPPTEVFESYFPAGHPFIEKAKAL